jgi:hypothetical protein
MSPTATDSPLRRPALKASNKIGELSLAFRERLIFGPPSQRFTLGYDVCHLR